MCLDIWFSQKSPAPAAASKPADDEEMFGGSTDEEGNDTEPLAGESGDDTEDEIRRLTLLYHSYQDCPTDFHMLHSELLHDHVVVSQPSHGFPCVMRLFT